MRILITGGTCYLGARVADFLSLVFQKLYQTEIPNLLTDGSKVDIHFKPEKINRFSYNTEKIQELGFEVNMTIEKGIAELFKYLENNA